METLVVCADAAAAVAAAVSAACQPLSRHTSWDTPVAT